MAWCLVRKYFQQCLPKIRNIGTSHYRMSQSTKVSALPPKPKPPDDSDCCDSGCTLCVKDIYEQELKIWENECKNILLDQAPKSTISPDVYTKCRLIDITPMTRNTTVYTFDSKGYVEIKPGQHLIVRQLIGETNVTRQYTPIAVPKPDEFTFKIMIKYYRDGILTPHIHRSWSVGDEIEWRGPHGVFLHQPNKYMKYVMLAAGTGIAPMLNVARSVVGDDNDITTIKLLYACQTYEDVLLKPELKKLAQHWNFTYTMYFSQDEDVNKKKGYGENVVNGKIEQGIIFAELAKLQSTRLLICGTRPFDSSMVEYCQNLQVPPENVYKF